MANEKDFQKSLAFLLRKDISGGFNNIPGDSGGPTNYDISLKFLAGTGDYDLGDLDHDGDIDIDDIRKMDPETAGLIYEKYFWDKFPMREIPAQIAAVMFDVAVNSGHKTAARLLQECLHVKPDGIIGPQTLYALKLIDSEYMFAERMCTRRKQQYLGYVAHDPEKGKFLAGWLNRVDKLRKHLFEY